MPVALWADVANSRIWSIVLHAHDDLSFTPRVSVDGKGLRPECNACSGIDTLLYIEAALIDARPGDRLILRAQGTAGIVTFVTGDARVAMRWLSEQVPPEANQEAAGSAARSGIRAAVQPADDAERTRDEAAG